MGDLADGCLEQKLWEQGHWGGHDAGWWDEHFKLTHKIGSGNASLFTGISLNGEMAQLTLEQAEMEEDVDEEGSDDWDGWDDVGNTNDLEEKIMSGTVPDSGSPRLDPGEAEATQAVDEMQRARNEAALATMGVEKLHEELEELQKRQVAANAVAGRALTEGVTQPAAGLPSKIQAWHAQRQTDQIKILVYGQSGVGKTVFAATAPDVLFLDADGGMMSVERSVSRWGITDWADLKEAHKYLRTPGHPFKTVVLDSLNAIQKLGMDSTVRSYSMKRTYDDLPTLSDWGKALDDFARLIRAFRALPMRVIYICATKNRDYDDERAEPQLSGKQTVSTMNQAMDVIAYLYVQERESGRKPDRVMAFDIANSITKDRTNKLPPTMIDPTWDKLEAFWK